MTSLAGGTGFAVGSKSCKMVGKEIEYRTNRSSFCSRLVCLHPGRSEKASVSVSISRSCFHRFHVDLMSIWR
jgi:hypothetical protein